ncbi:MAG: hypothetical protein WAZ63_14680, partial [Rhodoferax sp.]
MTGLFMESQPYSTRYRTRTLNQRRHREAAGRGDPCLRKSWIAPSLRSNDDFFRIPGDFVP